MKKISFWIIIIFISLFLPSCLINPGGFDSRLMVAASETELTRSEEAARRGSYNDNLCKDDRDCREVCEDVYDEDDEQVWNRKTCMELRYETAVQFKDILDIIKEPYNSSLKNVDEKAFSKFLDVSLAPWVTATNRLKNSEAEALLVWIAREERIGTAIAKAYENYEIGYDLFEGVENLFDEIGQCDDAIAGEKSFADIACAEENHPAMAIYEAVCKKGVSCRSFSRPDSFPSELNVEVESLLRTVAALIGLKYRCTLSGGAVDAALQDTVENCVRSCENADKTVACFDACGTDNNCDELIIGGGSGVFVANDQVLTNHHVIKSAVSPIEDRTHFTFFLMEVGNYSGDSSLVKEITWYDTENDIALVELESSLPSARRPAFGSLSQLRLLDKLITIGQPNFLKWTVSSGELTNKRHSRCDYCIAHSIPTGGGNSGGPIFNDKGELVGLHAGGTVTAGGSRYGNLGSGPHIDRIKHLLNLDGEGDVTDR